MKSKLSLALLALALLLPAAVRADHTGAQVAARLHADAHNLENVVRYAYLRYQVKQAVYNFTAQATALFQCASSQPRNGTWDHTGDCEMYEQRVRQSFYPVDRYLYDTYYDLPYVYQAYIQVKQDVQQIQ